MNLLFLKQAGVIALAVTNVLLLGWAMAAFHRKRAIPAGYDRLLPVSPGIVLFQLSMGFYFLLNGLQPNPMHIFYGSLVAVGAVLQLLLRPNRALGQKYRAKPLVHAAVSLFITLVAVRSWMSG